MGLQLNRYRALVEQHREAGAMHIRRYGWPPPETRVGAETGSSVEAQDNTSDASQQPIDDMRGRYTKREVASTARCCELCHEHFGSLWLHRGVCYACEMQLRETVS